MTYPNLLSVFKDYLQVSSDIRSQLAQRKADIDALSETQISRADIVKSRAQFVAQAMGAEVKEAVLTDAEAQIETPSYRFITETIWELEDSVASEFAPYLDADTTMSAHLDQEQANLLEQVLDPAGLYQAKRNEAFLCLATGISRLSKAQRRYFTPIYDGFKKQISILNSAAAAAENPNSPKPKNEVHAMQELNRDETHDQIVDAISRLQETLIATSQGSKPQSITTGFDRSLDDLQYSILGIPGLGTEAASTMSTQSLVDGLVSGLNHTVEIEKTGDGRKLTFNPVKQKFLSPDSHGAYGAIAIIADEVQQLSKRYRVLIADLAELDCVCDPENLKDILRELDDAFGDLINDASQPTGISALRFQAIYQRIFDLRAEYQDALGIDVDESVTKKSGASKAKPSATDTGLLVMDRNDGIIEALRAIEARLYDLLGQENTANGQIFARLVQTTDAIIPAVHEVRSALMRAGVSREDQRATFGQVDQHASDVSQTLEWIERDTEKWRLAMRTTKFGMRDLNWVTKALTQQSAALRSFIGENSALTKSVTDNRFALGRRQLNELVALLDQAHEFATHLNNRPAQ